MVLEQLRLNIQKNGPQPSVALYPKMNSKWTIDLYVQRKTI